METEIVSKRAPGLNREFAGEDFDIMPVTVWNEERERAKSEIITDSAFEVFASDIDAEVLEVARENAKRAGVSEMINIFEKDARSIKKLDRRGTIVCNPPYGERLMTPREVEALYRDMGKTFASLEPWQIYILTSAENFERVYGRRADKTRKLYNGMIPCSLYQYFKPKR